MQDDLIGARLANYEIESALGRGGMARVYKAWDTTLKRPAAIKVIDPGLSSEERYRERFEREAQAIAALEHPTSSRSILFARPETCISWR
jgi:serine/threonine-protein kinase